MNKTLSALMAKLTWQLNEVTRQLQAIDVQCLNLQEKFKDTERQTAEASAIPITHPEQELARLNFIIQHQRQYEDLSIEKKFLESRRSQLQARQSRLYTELKMLKKYQEKQQKNDSPKALLV